MTIKFDEIKQDKRVHDLYKREEEDLAKILGERHGLPYVDLSGIPINTNGLRLIPEDRARKAKIAIFDLVGRKVKIAVLSPNNDGTQNEIKALQDRYIIEQIYMVSTASLEHAWSRYKDISFATESKAGALEVSNEEITKFISQVQSIESATQLITETMSLKKAFRISRIVEIVIASAIAVNASDIHVEPEQEGVQLRFRIDGILVPIVRFDQETFKLLLSRIKLLSGMKLNIRENAQDGRFSVKIGDTEIEIRSSILPGAYDESIVMRLLNPDSISVELSTLGIGTKLMEVFEKELAKPNGLILNTGPTGSGKTTTLYAFLKHKITPGIKIITIENPIEYHLDGIVQTQVDHKKGYDFAKGLKSSLRQDPDVIMVGEIREIDTAETAIHASLTGHLVFSTLHTNTAAGAYTRLIDLGINPKILTSAINMVIAQRLVRKLCVHCKIKGKIPKNKYELIRSIYSEIKEPEVPFTEDIYTARPEGCAECNGGYSGRVAIYEAVLSDKKVEEALQLNPSEREIRTASRSQGIMDMAEDGIIKMLKGITTIEEVERVVNLEKREGYMEKGIENISDDLLRSDFDNLNV